MRRCHLPVVHPFVPPTRDDVIHLHGAGKDIEQTGDVIKEEVRSGLGKAGYPLRYPAQARP